MKEPQLAGHSRRVADLAERAGRVLSLPEARLGQLYRAGLLYDIGLVAVPSFVPAKPHDRLTEAEREQYRLHPYHSQRIVARIPAFENLTPAVAAHHERLDGRGYPAGTSAAQIGREARILGVTDRFDVLTHDTPEGAAIPVVSSRTTSPTYKPILTPTSVASVRAVDFARCVPQDPVT